MSTSNKNYLHRMSQLFPCTVAANLHSHQTKEMLNTFCNLHKAGLTYKLSNTESSITTRGCRTKYGSPLLWDKYVINLKSI